MFNFFRGIVRKFMINEEKYKERISIAQRDKEALIRLLNEIDAEKRRLRGKLRKIAHSTKVKGLISPARRHEIETFIVKDVGKLKELREDVRFKIRQLNLEKTRLNVNSNKGHRFNAAFMTIAEDLLDKKTFEDIKRKAIQLVNTQA